MPQAFKNILIIKPSSLGDIVLALPALSALRKSFPDADISWLVRPEFAPLLENHPHLTEIIPFDRDYLGRCWYNPGAMRSLLSLLRRLRQSKFDAVFDFQGLFRTAFFSWVSRCKNRFSMAETREFADIFYTHKIPQDTACAHLVDYYLEIIRAAGASELDVEFVLPQNPAAADSAHSLLQTHDIPPDNYAVLVPGSAHADKCWPAENFAALADKISAQFGLYIVATGTSAEAHLAEKLNLLANVRVTNLAGRTSLAELLALLRTAKLVISNDTGPGHIAAALARPLVMLFGRSNPARVAPYGRENCLAAIEPHRRGLTINSADPKHDIKAVSVDDVYKKVLSQLKPHI